MMEYLKNIKALTIIEILVAIILTAIVMLHGTLFFIATWRLSSESKDYNMVLNDLTSNLEKYISEKNNNVIGSNFVTITSNNSYVIKNRNLRNNKQVQYFLAERNIPSYGNVRQVISSATWTYENNAAADTVNRICILSGYLADRWN